MFKLHRNEYKGVFEVADYEAAVRIQKFKMAYWIWRPFLTKFEVFCWNFKVQITTLSVVKIAIKFSPCTIPRSKIRNSKWWIQDGGHFFTKFDVFCSNCTEINIRGFSRSPITISRLKVTDSRMRIEYSKNFWLNLTFFLQIAQKWI